ncbi:LuxR family quorum-sensing system transcriptional regulator CciR [Sphingomonas zeicaulis]|uniref:helix-turn-helix transcriptional regulator n=1 Tax=Sphingomonas zeicaulis TaxID=1632740 RepID=UPI003D22620B
MPQSYALSVVSEFVERSALVREPGSLEQLLASTVRSLGFEFFALTHHGDLVRKPNGFVSLQNYPREWGKRFRADGLHRWDPIQQLASQTSSAFLWSDVMRRLRPSDRQLTLLAEAQSAGLGAGLTVPLHAPGEPAASLSLVVSSPDTGISRQCLIAAQCLAVAAYSTALRLRGPMRSSIRTKLTRRQIQCVELAAEGKTDWEIGRILGLSEETVTKYMNAARGRYGVARRTQLIVAALRDGSIGRHVPM